MTDTEWVVDPRQLVQHKAVRRRDHTGRAICGRYPSGGEPWAYWYQFPSDTGFAFCRVCKDHKDG